MKINFEFTYKNSKEYRMIFENIECLIAALEQSDSETTEGDGANDVAMGSQDTEAPENAPAYTVEDLRKAFTSLARSRGKAAAKSILKELGAASVTGIASSDYLRAMELIEKAVV